MLLDDFMQGFIFTLVRQKWERFTCYAFYTLRSIEAVYLICVIAMSFLLKFEPSFRSKMLAIFVTVASFCLISVELAQVTCFCVKGRAASPSTCRVSHLLPCSSRFGGRTTRPMR